MEHAITFIHTADWHLGKPFAGIHDSAKRSRVQQERFESVRRIQQTVRERNAQFVVIAGDLFDSVTPTHATISSGLSAISELEVPVFVIPGNHDYGGPGALWEQPFFRREQQRIAPNFVLLADRTHANIRVQDQAGQETDVALFPCPLLRRHESDDPTAWLREYNFSKVGNNPRIVIAHGSTIDFSNGFSQDDDEDLLRPSNTIALERLPEEEIDYIALGDFHGCMKVGGKAWYSGAPEIDRFPKMDQQPGHVISASIIRGEQPRATMIPTGGFRWISLNISLDDTSSVEGEKHLGAAYLEQVLMQATCSRAEDKSGFNSCLVNATLTGTVSLEGRRELDQIIESWEARLLRLKLADTVMVAPTQEEIHVLTTRSQDPIIARVASELLARLQSGDHAQEREVIRQAISILYSMSHSSNTNEVLDPAAVPP